MGALLLCSGGLDSTTVAYLLVEKRISFQPAFFDYGQHCVEKEWASLQKVLPKDGVVRPTRIDISGIFSGSRSRLIREPDLWTGIFLHNREAILKVVADLGETIGQFRSALEAGDRAALDALLTQGKRNRDALGSRN